MTEGIAVLLVVGALIALKRRTTKKLYGDCEGISCYQCNRASTCKFEFEK